MQNVQSYTGIHWILPSGKYSLRIAPAAARVAINSMIMKHVSTLLAVSMTITCGDIAGIARWRRFVAFVKATKCHYHYRTSTHSDSIKLDTPTPVVLDISS